jgi:hypothetical protein
METEVEEPQNLVNAKTISTPVTMLILLQKRGLIIPTHAMMMMTFGG